MFKVDFLEKIFYLCIQLFQMQSVPNLIAIYYKNIGPFQRECSILFEDGKYLIKANIGSGKSFLFFDGPTYALYGSSGDKNSTGSILFF